MDTTFISEMKTRLLQQQAELKAQISDSAHQGTTSDDDPNTQFPQYGASPDDNALEVSNYQDNISVQHGLQEELDQIGQALQKLEHGTYGVCDNCGETIPQERLAIFPAAILCVRCSKVKV